MLQANASTRKAAAILIVLLVEQEFDTTKQNKRVANEQLQAPLLFLTKGELAVTLGNRHRGKKPRIPNALSSFHYFSICNSSGLSPLVCEWAYHRKGTIFFVRVW
jgi:hypothetical protein